jgi:glutamyl-tRNA reductase
LASELGGRAIQFEELTEAFAKVDIVISSTSAPHYILDGPKLEPVMRKRRQQPLLLIDIAVPRDIDPDVNRLENVYLYNIDDLQAIAAHYLRQRQEEIARCERIIHEKALALLEHQPRPKPSLPAARPAFNHD